MGAVVETADQRRARAALEALPTDRPIYPSRAMVDVLVTLMTAVRIEERQACALVARRVAIGCLRDAQNDMAVPLARVADDINQLILSRSDP